MSEYKEKGEDLIVYTDKDYVIIKKYGNILGTMSTAFDLLDIGLASLEKEQHLLFSNIDFKRILNSIISRIEKVREVYPSDDEINKLYKKNK